MTREIVFTIFVVISLTALPIFSVSSANSIETISVTDEESYIIKGVPYAEQETGFSCDYAPMEMVLRYYGLNTTDIEICYFSGGGYSEGYGLPLERMFSTPPRKLPYRFSCPGDITVGGPDDYKFLATLLGLSFEAIYPNRVINHEKMWREYWDTIKDNVKNNIPVIAMLDPVAWPPYRELKNITGSLSPFVCSCCETLIVGFNETNGTICVNDQYVGYEKGFYRWVNLEDFRTAVKRAYFELRESRYSMNLIKKISDPLPKDIIHELVHKRNIERMKGVKSSYDSVYITENFKEFGINALKKLMEDISSKFITEIPLYYFINKIFNNTILSYSCPYPFKKMLKDFDREAMYKHLIAQYLKENANMSSYHERDAMLLELESKHWENLTASTEELKETLLKYPLMKSIKLSKDIVARMTNIIDDIIATQETIVCGG